MNNGVGQRKKSARRTQLKFRSCSLTAKERLCAKRLETITILTVFAMANMQPGQPALQLLPFVVLMLIRRRHLLLTNYTPLIHNPVVRRNINSQNFPDHLAWCRLRFHKEHLGGLMSAFGINENLNYTLQNGSSVNAGFCFLFMLARMASLKTLEEHEEFWGRTNDVLSRMFCYMISRIYNGYKHLVQNNLA